MALVSNEYGIEPARGSSIDSVLMSPTGHAFRYLGRSAWPRRCWGRFHRADDPRTLWTYGYLAVFWPTIESPVRDLVDAGPRVIFHIAQPTSTDLQPFLMDDVSGVQHTGCHE